VSNPVSLIFRFILKLVLGLFAALLAVSLLTAALIVFALSLLKSLITGKKASPAVVFGRFQQFSQQGVWPGQRTRQDVPKAASGEVVDVEVREIPEVKRSS
jgi:hypothetical protein